MSDLLKQAIADAKAVRATALSNAKAALEEHFAPKLQSMLSEKLKAEVEAAGEDVAEPALDAEQPVDDFGGDEMGDEAPLPVADVNVDVEAPVEAPVGGDNPDAAIDGGAPVEDPSVDAAATDAEIEEVFGTEQAGNVDVTQHGVSHVTEGEKASSDYKKTTSGHKTQNSGQEVVDSTKLSTKGSLKSPASSSKASSNYKTDAKHGGPVKDMHNKSPKTQDPQGPSDELADGLKKDDKGTSPLKENDEVDEASLDEILKELEASVQDVGQDVGADEAAPEAAVDADEEINLNELLSEDDDAEDCDDEEKKSDDKDDDKPDFLKENNSLKKELQEYRSAVVYLRDRINEVNLLNAKLLYTNKLFKQASLTNEQKLKVIESFDLTKSVREAKLVYATLAESFNFGGKKPVVEAKKPVSATVKAITEGLASKPVASTKPTKAAVLTEGAEMANRFKKLAGIRQ